MQERLKLFQRTLMKNDIGEHTVVWKLLGTFWADLTLFPATYPFKKDGQERYEGCCYRVVMRYTDDIFKTKKIVFQENDFFLMQSPEVLKKNFITFKIFSWETKNYV